MTAKEMFQERGFERFENERAIIYIKSLFRVTFIKNNRSFITEYEYGSWSKVNYQPFEIEPPLLKAINQQMQELGWI